MSLRINVLNVFLSLMVYYCPGYVDNESIVSFNFVSEIPHCAEPFHATLHNLCVRCTIRHYAKPLHATLHCLYVRCTIRHYAEPFHTTLHCFYVRCTIRHYAEPFHAALHHMFNSEGFLKRSFLSNNWLKGEFINEPVSLRNSSS